MSKKGKKIKRLKDTVKVLNDKVETQKELIHWQRAENAKLRGMVAVLWECCACNTDSFWCDGCDYHDVDGCKVKAQIDRMGIEVE